MRGKTRFCGDRYCAEPLCKLASTVNFWAKYLFWLLPITAVTSIICAVQVVRVLLWRDRVLPEQEVSEATFALLTLTDKAPTVNDLHHAAAAESFNSPCGDTLRSRQVTSADWISAASLRATGKGQRRLSQDQEIALWALPPVREAREKLGPTRTLLAACLTPLLWLAPWRYKREGGW